MSVKLFILLQACSYLHAQFLLLLLGERKKEKKKEKQWLQVGDKFAETGATVNGNGALPESDMTLMLVTM